ncbi:MAG TPA: hypothetical protein VFF47_02535 [Nitrospirota bacterium]|nr:hypothetical protein [Nitrospirota bacterium]
MQHRRRDRPSGLSGRQWRQAMAAGNGGRQWTNLKVCPYSGVLEDRQDRYSMGLSSERRIKYGY